MGLPEIREAVIDHKHSRLTAPWGFHSKVLGCYVKIERGFVYDHESIPLFKGTSKRGGLVHDYLCRTDSDPIVKKKQAADVYLEIMAIQGNSAWRRYGKYWVVRIWRGYFHKHTVLATYEEISGRSRK